VEKVSIQGGDKDCIMQRGFMTEQEIFAGTHTAASANSGKALAFAALILGNVAIAFGPLLVRYSDTGPIATGFWRLALALPILAFFGHRSGFRLGNVPPGILWLAIFAGTAFGLDIVAWHIGIFQTKMANATLFANCASILLVFYGIYVARKLPGKMQAIAILMALAGSALLMGQSFELSARNFVGDLLCLVAGLLYTVYLVFMIRVRATTDSWGALAMVSCVGAVVLLTAAIMADEQIIPGNWGPVMILALTSQVIGQGCLTYALRHFRPLIIGLALLLQPALSAAAGWIAFGEVLTLFDLIGGVLVMAALVLVRLSDPAR
jgi:drug/metabolite transporter (DMT)-like permease